MKAIGIDIGTTSICGILLDCETGKILKSITENSQAFLPTDKDWEKIQDTGKIMQIALTITDTLMEDTVKVIGVTGQMHGIVYYDADGKAVSPLYTWQDGRGNQPYDETRTYSEFLQIPAGYGAVTDFYNTKNGIRPAEAVGYCTIHDYFAMTLAGRKTPLLHTSDAASFGDFDLRRNCFHHSFVGDITADFAILGSYKGVPVSVAIGDNQASVFGAVSSDEDILLNIGTGSQISVISSSIVEGENIEVRPYPGGKYLLVGAALCGGRSYSMLEKFYSDIVYAATGTRMSMYEVMDKMENSNLPLTVDTRFAGTRQDPSVTGSITHITTENFTPGALRYAFLNGIIQELFSMYAQMQQKTGALIGSGNGIRKNKALIAAAEKAFGATMKIPAHMEEAAFGAALFGMVATGEMGTVEEIKQIIRYQEA
ncbi:MAG: hypothetical protein IJB80_00100 [Clostridia bacterium]|nr:hypothetical protein [Clostridia bacterium]